MTFFESLINSLSLVPSLDSRRRNPNSIDQSMEGGVGGDTAAGFVATANERVAYKLKGYFDLAKEEIDKAVRAEELGTVAEAIVHYRNALRILVEGSSTPSFSYISPRYPTSVKLIDRSELMVGEQQKVKSYRQKISKWQGQVSERLGVLCQQSAGIANKVQRTNVGESTAPSSSKKDTHRRSQQSGVSTPVGHDVVGIKPGNKAGPDYDDKLVEMINTAIVDRSPTIKWDDVAGLDKAKQALMEMVILPTKRKDLFIGLRRPARGLLLFGPPGNGKTMLAKAVASESEATFFNVSAASLTSKWVGEGEKLVRTLFMVAISKQPSVIFIDEIDSIMSTRVADENEASRRLKSEFLVQFDGVTSNSDDLVIVIGATNKPQELDDAVLRRLVKRIYVPLPDENVRRLLLKTKLKGQAYSLPGGDLERLVEETEGYSGSDLQALCEEAAMMPIRELGSNILTVKASQVRPLNYMDFEKAMKVIRPSLQKSKWEELHKWNQEFGSN